MAVGAEDRRELERILDVARPRFVASAVAVGYADAILGIRDDVGCWFEFRGGRGGLTWLFSEQLMPNFEGGIRVDGARAVVEHLENRVLAAARRRAPRSALKLYWIGDGGGEDDWFVVAPSARSARMWYAYDVGDTSSWMDLSCTLVARLPPALQKVDDEVFNCSDARDAGWPSHKAIEACGGHILREVQPRVVVLAGKTFTEGMLDFLVEQAQRPVGRPRPPSIRG